MNAWTDTQTELTYGPSMDLLQKETNVSVEQKYKESYARSNQISRIKCHVIN